MNGHDYRVFESRTQATVVASEMRGWEDIEVAIIGECPEVEGDEWSVRDDEVEGYIIHCNGGYLREDGYVR